MLDFVALDFETANKFKNSACSLAVITVKDGQIIKKAYSLIKPPFMSLMMSVLRFMAFNRRMFYTKRPLINCGMPFMKTI